MAGEIQTSIRGLQTLCGGTRTSVKVDRPWQPKMVFPTPNPCPFCTKKQEDEYMHCPDDYFYFKTFQNSNTPFPYHRLLIPTRCWEERELRNLGGRDALGLALECAFKEVLRTRPRVYPTWIYTHIGYGAGQNLTHNHWHLCGAPTEPKPLAIDGETLFAFSQAFADKSSQVILSFGQFVTAIVHGVRAGQVIIAPHSVGAGGIITTNNFVTNPYVQKNVFDTTHQIVNLFNQKFNYPDYCLFVALNSETDWHIRYIPILNNWGGSEFAALDYGTPFVLPWPHSETVKFLKS